MNSTSLHSLIESARKTADAIRELEAKLSELKRPVFTDFSKLHEIHRYIQAQLPSETLRERRICFVFIAAYLYSPASVIGDHPLKVGLRTNIGVTIGRCKGEVSELFSEAKFRYEKLISFGEKVDKILKNIIRF